MRGEEKLARDVYLTLYETWQFPVFRNIPRSEQRHSNAIKALLTKYNINDPYVDDTVDITNQKHYNKKKHQMIILGYV